MSTLTLFDIDTSYVPKRVFGHSRFGIPGYFVQKTGPQRKRSGVWFFLSAIEDTPAVEMPVLAFGDLLEVFSTVVEGVMIDMVYFEMVRTFKDQSVHADCVGFALDDFSGYDVFGA